jgi:hypothetical protein
VVSVCLSALDVLFDDPNLGLDAAYASPLGGAAVPVRVVLRQPGRGSDLLQTGSVVPGLVAEVRAAELHQPEEGGQLAIGGDTYTVRSFDSDALGLIWRLALAPA